jgi:hypothetical protein
MPNQAAEKTIYLLTHPAEAKVMGEKGKEQVKKNLLTVDNLNDFSELFMEEEEIALA